MQHEVVQTRQKYKADGVDIDDAEVQKRVLTIILRLKKSKATKMTYTFPAPDWDSKEQVSDLKKAMNQVLMRKAGKHKETRLPYNTEEEDFIVDWFQADEARQGGMGHKSWDKLVKEFNEEFVGESRQPKGGLGPVIVEARSMQGMRTKCGRDERILRARGINPKTLEDINGSTGKRSRKTKGKSVDDRALSPEL